MRIRPLHATDFYKADHRRQYPKGTSRVYANWTARKSRLPDFNEVVFFGVQMVLQELHDMWQQEFFSRPQQDVLREYKTRMDSAMGPNMIPLEHIRELHDVGHLPIKICALPEGTKVLIGVPMLSIENTRNAQFWITNYLETPLSNSLWKPITAATLAVRYREVFNRYAQETTGFTDFCRWQGHDFSMRGLSSLMDSAAVGAAHLTAFNGTDTILALDAVEDYYHGLETFLGGSVPATEHSVMCMGEQAHEIDTFRRLITEVYPKGIVSIVSDTWDYWQVITKFLPELKDVIINRHGKVVIRPDSGDPVKIIIGDPDAPAGSPERKGSIECLLQIFGYTVNALGYKVLNPKIGLIYGDSITLDRQQQILEGLKRKGIATDCVVLGIGSFTYQYQTRDTFGFAMKATWGVVNDEPRMIFKDPKTDNGTKKSLKGRFSVARDANGRLTVHDGYLDPNAVPPTLLRPIYVNGEFLVDDTFAAIRERIGCWGPGGIAS